MHSYIQFITTPAADTPGTGLILHFDEKRYFFGQAHEGLQRASLQHGAKVFKVREMFLTGVTGWQTTGGLIGLILTLADSAKASLASQNEQQRLRRDRAVRRAKLDEEQWSSRRDKPGKMKKPRPVESIPEVAELTQEPLGIHGGPNISHMLATARSFVFRQGMPLDVDEITASNLSTSPKAELQPTWQDAHVKVWAMPISSQEQGDMVEARIGVSSKKRDLEHYMNGQQQEPTFMEDNQIPAQGSTEEQAQKIRENALHEMFRSAWRYDNLVETALADVEMSAKLFIRDPATDELKPYKGPTPNGTQPLPDINVLVRQPWPGALITDLPPTTPSSTSMSYIVRNHKQRGKFMAKTAKSLGVPPFMNSLLAKGECVTLNDGRVIRPDQVLEAEKEGGGVAVIDLPSRHFIAALLRRPEWREEEIMKGVQAFIWILGPDVAQDTSLLGFIEEFKHCKHIISSPNHCPNQLMMTSAAVAAVQHHLIDPERYTLLQHHNVGSEDVKAIASDPGPIMAKPGLMVQLEPSFQVQDHEVSHPVNLIQAIDQVPPAVWKLAKQAKDDIKTELAQLAPEDQGLPSPDAEIVCLGTGSASPSLHRNVAGTLLRVPGQGSYLFDLGENTLGQLRRMYSPAELAEIFRDLKMIWVSHLHADHHLGMAAVIKAWYEAVHGQDLVKRRRASIEDRFLRRDKIFEDGRRLFVVGARKLVRWLSEYSSVEDYGYDQLVPLDVSQLASAGHALRQTKFDWDSIDLGFEFTGGASTEQALRHAMGIEDILVCRVSHCVGAMAVAVTFPDGFKFSYSGDCRPSHDFAIIGKDSTVLVHEATFDDEMQSDAIAKKHSTISEALGVGASMGARRVILTHFSQRYSRIPTIADVQGSSVKLEQAEADDGDEGGPVQDLDAASQTETSAVIAHEAQQATNSKLYETHNEFSKLDTLPRWKDLKIAFAFDYMKVKVKDIASLERFVPALRELYKAYEVKPLEERTKTPFADGGVPPESSNVSNNKQEKDNDGNGLPKSGAKHQAAPHGEDAKSTAAYQKRENKRAGIGLREPGSIIRMGGKPNLKQVELVERDDEKPTQDSVGLVDSHVTILS